MKSNIYNNLVHAENIALKLFHEIKNKKLITAGKDETTLNEEIYYLAKIEFSINKYWHKRIVRCGQNTLKPYQENPPNLIIQENDILFLDFGPIIDDWEADLGRTYIIGDNPAHHKIKNDIENAWITTKKWAIEHTSLKASKLYDFTVQQAKNYGWEFGGAIAGHIIGQFPHEKLAPDNYKYYIHPENSIDIFSLCKHWILEMHFIDPQNKFGAFYEQILI